MNKPELSILMAGFRAHKWKEVYDSILRSTKRTFEFVIVSPHETLPPELKQYGNIRHFQDFGSPMRAGQIAACMAQSDVWVYLMADDGVYLNDAIDNNVNLLYSMGDNYKNVVVCPYFEGPNGYRKVYQPNEYYLINYHDASRAPVPNNWIGFNNTIIYRKFFEELGGWDCKYETCPMGLVDLAIRAQRNGANAALTNVPIIDFDWCPGDSGDHGPIFYGQTQHDEPLYKETYKNGMDCLPIKIDMMNWKNAPSVWERRFKK